MTLTAASWGVSKWICALAQPTHARMCFGAVTLPFLPAASVTAYSGDGESIPLERWTGPPKKTLLQDQNDGEPGYPPHLTTPITLDHLHTRSPNVD
jgi:hypothetical protein